MGSSTQLYNLEWSDFGQSLKQTVGGLRSHGDLFDVTLAAEGKTFPAHKIVLSASSPLLLDLLKVTPCKHPVILLPGVTAANMEFLLEFIYTGEVNVHSDRLPSLFQAARLLDIHGLSQGKVSSDIPLPMQEDALRTVSTFGQEDKDCRVMKRAKRKWCADMSLSSEKWPRWEAPTNDESVEIEMDRRSSTSADPNYRISPKQGTEAAVTLATLQNVVPMPGSSWNKVAANSRNRTSMSEERGSIAKVPPHHLPDLNNVNEEQVDDRTFSTIAAEADAAAVAAATLSDRKGSSDQPVACPVCHYVIKQSRNLRRHLEIKHFGGGRPRKHKGKTRAAQTKDGNDTDNESSPDHNVIDHVQVEIESPAVDDNMANAATDPKEVHHQTYPQQLQQYVHVEPALLSHQMVASTAGAYVPQHIQSLKGSHGNPHPLLPATVTQPGTHFLGLYRTEENRPPSHH